MASMEGVDLDHVSYSYPGGVLAGLRDVSLSFAAGEFVLVMGPSGGGKSTLLRCLNGLVPHFYGGTFSGRVRVLGRDPVALGPREMSDLVGFVFQDPEAQFIVDDVEGELAFSMEARAYPRPLMAERITEVSRLMGIEHLLGRRVSTLSGGQRQRVAVAAALAVRPSVLVLDEPTSQLDPVAADELLSALVDLNRRRGLTVVLSEHRLERVVQYVDRVIYVPGNGGEMLVGSPHEVLPQVPLAPPVVRLGRALHWQPPPITVEEAEPLIASLAVEKRDGKGQHGHSARPPLLQAEGVSYAYSSLPALSDLSLVVREGEILAIQGHNGAGKTTLLKTLVGLLRPQSGRVLLAGRDIRDMPMHEVIAEVGYVPQSPGSLLFQESVLQELEFTRRSHRLPPLDGLPLLARLGLSQYVDTYPRDLSQGERQRVALAAILVAEPRVLLLDEPTLGLDYLQKAALVEVLRDLRAEGRTVVVATHDTELVAACADRTIVLENGRVADEGTPGEVMLRHEAFASQIGRLFHDGLRLTVEDVL